MGPNRSMFTQVQAGIVMYLKSGMSPMTCFILCLRFSLQILHLLSQIEAYILALTTQQSWRT